jgi:O-acetyl-ADP-ribose deacetylase (regulator of RNase III)
VDADLATAWQAVCGDLPNISIHRGSIFDVDCDAVVSPANSFGFMDGGIDLRYSQYFGWDLQRRLQDMIRTRHHGELLVGIAEVVTTNDPRIPFLIAAPTMRVPMILRDSVNPYLAAKAVLVLIKHGRFADGPFLGQPLHEVIRTVAVPGLGTGVGQIPPRVCAIQVRRAIEELVLERREFPVSFADAQDRHQRLYDAEPRDLQVESPRRL